MRFCKPIYNKKCASNANKTHRFIFSLSLLSLVFLFGQAKANDDWQQFDSHSEGIDYLNFKTEVWEGDEIVSIWQLTNLLNRGADGEKSILVYKTFNCAKRSYGFRQIMWYEKHFGEGKEIFSHTYPNPQFKYTKPGSYGEYVMRFMCRLDP